MIKHALFCTFIKNSVDGQEIFKITTMYYDKIYQ